MISGPFMLLLVLPTLRINREIHAHILREFSTSLVVDRIRQAVGSRFSMFLCHILYLISHSTKTIRLLALDFCVDNKKEIPGKNLLKPVKFQIWLKNVVMCGRYSLTKLANFLIVLRAKIVTIIEPKVVTISAPSECVDQSDCKKCRSHLKIYTKDNYM